MFEAAELVGTQLGSQLLGINLRSMTYQRRDLTFLVCRMGIITVPAA